MVTDGTPPFKSALPVSTLLAHLRVQTLLKGELPENELNLELYRLDLEALARKYPNGFGLSGALPFSGMEVNTTYIVFAKKQDHGQRYWLVSYGQSTPSVIATTEPSRELTKRASPLVNVLLQIVASLSAPDQKTRFRAIELLGEFGTVLREESPYYESERIEQLRKTPEYEELQETVRQRAVPAILQLVKRQDVGVRTAALISAADLQIVEIIPQLVAQVDNSSINPDALSRYRVHAAVPLLIPLLKNDNPEVRRNVVRALEVIRSRRSLPYLLEALSDKDRDIRYRGTHALYNLVGEMPPTTVELFSQEEEEYINFWRNWVARHEAELKELRQSTERA